MPVIDMTTLSARERPWQSSDSLRSDWRGSEYGEPYVEQLGSRTLAEGGSYFFKTSSVFGHASPATTNDAVPVFWRGGAPFDKPLLLVRNSDPLDSRRIISVELIDIEVSTVGVGGVSTDWSMQIDSGHSRYISGGFDGGVYSANTPARSAATSAASIWTGAVLARPQSDRVRHIGAGRLSASAQVAGDRVVFAFGQSRRWPALPPVILGPSDQLLLSIYSSGQSTASSFRVVAIGAKNERRLL
jgi:hypothetical protein